MTSPSSRAGWIISKSFRRKPGALGYEFTHAEVDLILGENAKKLFKL